MIFLIVENIEYIESMEGRALEIKYEIPDDKVRSFTGGAKKRLCEQAKTFTIEIVNEAEKVEGLIRENGATVEITENIVFQAIRRNKTGKKKNVKIIVMRVFADLFLFVSGLMFIPEMFITSDKTLNITYFIGYIIVTLIAFIFTVVTYFIGGD